jgi:hypothetical protein
MKVYQPLEHSDYTHIDEDCLCRVCVDWRQKFETIKVALETTMGHKRNCYCDRCRSMRKAKAAYLAALNRRDFYCEMSWHAGHNTSGVALKMMEWVEEQLDLRSDGWWYVQSSRMMIGDWLDKFGGVCSGAANAFAMATSGMVDIPIAQ